MHDIESSDNSNFDPKIWYFFIFSVLFLSIMRGIRFPNVWSYTHFLFNYDFGFTKRGLIGEILNKLNDSYLMTYDFFLIFSAVIFFMNIILISLLLKNLIDSRKSVFIGCSLVFSSSLAVVFLSHSIGYFDHIGLLIALITQKISGFYRKIIFLFISMPFALLIHEAILIIFFPVIFMSLLFSIEKKDFVIKKITILSFFSASMFLLTLLISNYNLEKSEAYEMHDNLQASIRFSLRKDAFNVLHRDSKDNFQLMKNAWLKNKNRFLELTPSILATAPTIAIFIYFSILLLKKSKTDIYLIVLSVLAALSPLLLHFFGWDMHRWNTLTITTSFIMLNIAYSSKLKNQPTMTLNLTTSNHIYPAFIFVIFLNGASSIPLFDGYRVEQFPFIEHQKYVFDLIRGRETFPNVPSR